MRATLLDLTTDANVAGRGREWRLASFVPRPAGSWGYHRGGGDTVRYLLGDSTESNLEFNYLAFLREVVDCAVVLLESEATLATNAERRTTRASEFAGMIRAVEELGKDAAALVEPIAKEQPKTPAGRCAAAIAKAIKDAVGTESSHAKSSLAAARDEIDRDDIQVRARARTVLDKLLRAHDLPEATRELEAVWTASGVKATMRQKTGFGVEAVLSLEASGNAVLVSDLRVERIAEGVEVHAREAGGWLKKGDKLVAQKLGRYQVSGVTVSASHVTVQLRSAPDASATGLAFTLKRSGEMTIDSSAPGKEYEIEDRDRAALKTLAEKLEGALRGLEDQRTGLVDLVIDGKSIAEVAHPRVLAERLIVAIAPTVQKISRHSRSPGELVLRRQLSGDRREEVFISIAELTKRIETLPEAERRTFAPLELEGTPVPAPPAPPPAPVVHAAPAPAEKPAEKPAAAPAEKPAARADKPAPEKTVSVEISPELIAESRRHTQPPPLASTAPARPMPRTVPPSPPPAKLPDHDAKLAASIDAALAEDES